MIPNHKRSFIATALASALTFTAAYAPTPAAGGPPTPESRIQALIPKLEAYIHDSQCEHLKVGTCSTVAF